MALTATAQSAFRREPTWNQVIVPTLRKRLQDESHVLSKRMSVASMTSEDPNYSPDTYQTEPSRERVPSPSYAYSRPSAIPRPSLQHSRTDGSSGRSSNSGSFKRPRTNSQPFPFDQSNGTSPPIPQYPHPVRSESPGTTKGTRIPVSRGRTGSTSSFQPSINGRSDSRTGLTTSKMNGYAPEPPAVDLYPVEEIQASSVNSRSTAFRTPRSQFSDLVHEQAPFNPNSISSRNYNYSAQPDSTPPRPSNESEERPFEHWYRGDVSRNGGVGELRVARRQEMLDIANYGHTLRQASPRLAFGTGTRSRSNSQGRDTPLDSPRTRPRAGSLGVRQSIYLDDDEQARLAAMVLDEQPLTDLDSDGEGYYEEFDVDEGGEEDEDMTERVGYSLPTNGPLPSPPEPSYDRSTTPTSTKELSKATFQSRIPTPTPRAAFTEPPRTPTPTQALSTPSTPRSRSQTQTQQQTQTQTQSTATNSAKRRGKSPTSSTATAAKKTRTAKSKSPVKQQKKDDQRRSASVYPAPDGDDITHAIPSWTQPMEANGNWDDVVLPAVARKKGLEGYEKADGSPKPRPPGPVIYEPAPGTFGFDNSKYRPPRTSIDPNDIPMDEFGQRKEPTPESSALSPPIREQPAPSPQPTLQRRPLSPAPFSHYVLGDGGDVGAVPDIKVTRPSMDQGEKMREDEEHSGGCCKCVIM